MANFGSIISSTLRKIDHSVKLLELGCKPIFPFVDNDDDSSPFNYRAFGNNYLTEMRHLGQEIPVKKAKRWEQLQGQLGYE